jgi:uncharacterized membrane protein YdjX (TVP38/TMEM64 family)
MSQATKSSLDKRVLVGGLAALGALTFVGYFVLEALGGAAHVEQRVRSAGAWGPLVYIGLKMVTYVVAPLNGAPLKVAAGAVFGIVPGALYSLAEVTQSWKAAIIKA